MRTPPARSGLLALIIAATLAACGDASGPEGGGREWWEGAWVAVQANNAPLPFVNAARGTTVREMVLVLNRDTTATSTFSSSGTYTANGRAVEDPVTRRVRVTPAADSVQVYDGPTATAGQLQLTFRRRADTLVLANYSGGEFKLVRSR
jgi:hypothetical protein